MGNVEGQELNLEDLTPEQRHHLQQQHELKRQQQQLLQEQQQLQQRLQHQQGGLQPQPSNQFSKQEEIQRLSPRKQLLQQQAQQPQQREVQSHLVQKAEQQRQQQQNDEQHRQPVQQHEEKPQQQQQREQQLHFRDSQQREQQTIQQRQVPQRQKQQEQHHLEQQQDHHQQQREQQSLHHQPQRHPQQQQKRVQSQPPQNPQRHYPPQPRQSQNMQSQHHESEQQSNNDTNQVQGSPAPVGHPGTRVDERQNMHKDSESFKIRTSNINKQQFASKNITQGVNSNQDNFNNISRRLNDPNDRSVQEDRKSPARREEHRRSRSSSPGQNQRGREKTVVTHMREGGREQMTFQSESGKPIKSQPPDERQHRTGQKAQQASSLRQERKVEPGKPTMHDNTSYRPGSPHKSGALKDDGQTTSDRQSFQHLPLQKVSQRGQHQQDSGGGQRSTSNITPSVSKMQPQMKSPMKSPMTSPMKSPMMPPVGDPFEDPATNLEADLSQLTEEERAHILAVLDRARQLQEKDEHRVREMEENLQSFTKEINERDYQSDSAVQEVNSCPICHKVYRPTETTPDRKDCDDCGRTVCPGCGTNVQSVDSETKTRHQLVRTASYSMVDDMRKTLHEEERESDTTKTHPKKDYETSQTKEETRSLVDSDELREEFLLLKRRSRDRSPEYERRTSAGQEEVLRDLRREERGFLISDNTIEMDPIDADHVEDLSEGLDEEEMMRQLMEMADGVDEDFGSLSDHSSSSGAQYFTDDIDDRHGEHQEILETTQQIAKFTESLNLSDYDLHETATREEAQPSLPSAPAVEIRLQDDSYEDNQAGQQTRRDTPAVQALEETLQEMKSNQSNIELKNNGERLSSSLESSPARDLERYHIDSIGRSSSVERESDTLFKEVSKLKHAIDVSSHSDSEIEQRKETSARKRRKRGSDGIRGNDSGQEEPVDTDKFLSVEDLREVGIQEDVSQETRKDLLMLPNQSRTEPQPTFESRGNRPPAAGRGSGSNRRKKGKKYLESPLSPIRDEESDPKVSLNERDEDDSHIYDESEKHDKEKFVYPPDKDTWKDENTRDDEDEEGDDEDEEYDIEGDAESGSSYLTSPGGLETVMEEQEEPIGDDSWTSKRNYSYGKEQGKRILTVSTDTIGEEIEDSSPEESKHILRLQDVPLGKRKSRDDEDDSKGISYDEQKSKSPDHVPPERRMEKVHPRRSPEMRQEDRKDMHAKDRPPLSRIVDSTSPASSPVSTRFRFSPPITPKLCSTGKSFPEATFPKDLTPTDETAHHEDVVDENRNEIVDKQETTPTNEGVEFPLRSQHTAAHLVDKPRHSKKRHAVSTQTERRKSHREISTQTKSEEEIQKQFSKEKRTKSFGVQAGEDLEILLPKKVLVDVGVETESDVSSTSSPVSFASSRSVGIETDSRDPNLSSGMSSPISDVGGERCYSEMAVQTVSESFVQTDPIAFDQSEMIGSPYFGMDRPRHTSPALSYQATQDPKVAQALRAVLGDFPPPTCRSYGMQASAGNMGGSDLKSNSPFRANGVSEINQHVPSDKFRSHGMQTSPLKLRDSSLSNQAASPSRSSGLSRPTSVTPVPDFPRRRPPDKTLPDHMGHSFRDTSAHVIASAIADHTEARVSHSDTESIDSDFGTPRIRRRLPHVPAGTSPSSSPVLGRSANEDNGDLQAEIELDKVRGLLSRKAIQLEMERRKHELDEMTSKIFGQNQNANLNSSQGATKPQSRAYTQQKFHSDGTLSDSDLVTHRKKINQKEPERNDKTFESGHIDKKDIKLDREKQGKDSTMGMDAEKYVQFSKSEEDIIREIERQVTQATGKQYSALELEDEATQDKGKGPPLPDRDYDYDKKQEPGRQEGKKPKDDKRQDAIGSRDQYQTELESQRYWDIDTSPVHTSELMPFVKDSHQSGPKDESYGLQTSRSSSSSAYSGVRRAPEGSERRKEPSRKTIPQLIKDNQNEVDRLSREGEEIERRIKELTELEEKLETDYQQYRTRITSDKQPRDYETHPETLADYILKSHEPSLRFEKTTDGQYEYTTAHWSNSDESLSGSGGKIASSSSESRLLPTRPHEVAMDDREMESGLILPLEEGSDFDGDLSSGSPASQRRERHPEISSSLPAIPKRELPPVSVHHSESRHKQARQLPIPKGDPHVTRSEGHRAQANMQQPPIPRRSRGERTSNIFHLKRNSNGPASGSGSGGDLGLRVVGGKRMPGSNQLVAYITDVVEGGVAQKTGLREGDQVLEWCGTPLTGKTFEEVQLIMRTARKMTDVTVKCGPNLLDSPRYRVQRPSGREVQRSHHGVNAPRSSSNHRREQPSSGHRGEHPLRPVVRPTSEGKILRITGELQIRLAYDAGRGELRVDVLRGRGLAGKTNDGLADPFVVVKLLPMKSASDEKRTACVPRTLTPEWNQTLLFRDLRPSELLTNHSLELTIWSSSRSPENYMGKVVFNLSETKHLDNRVHWYRLMNGSSGQGKAHKNIGFV